MFFFLFQAEQTICSITCSPRRLVVHGNMLYYDDSNTNEIVGWSSKVGYLFRLPWLNPHRCGAFPLLLPFPALGTMRGLYRQAYALFCAHLRESPKNY